MGARRLPENWDCLHQNTTVASRSTSNDVPKLGMMNATDSTRSSTAPPYMPTPEKRNRRQRYRRYRRNMRMLSKERRNFPEKTNERIETAKSPPWRNLC